MVKDFGEEKKNKQTGTYSFQCARFLLFLCCVADWMSSESGVKGLKLTSGVCCLLLLLSTMDFPAGSTFLNKATLRLEDPVPGPRALDSRLWRENTTVALRYSSLERKTQHSKFFLKKIDTHIP